MNSKSQTAHLGQKLNHIFWQSTEQKSGFFNLSQKQIHKL